ncbi:MAG: phospholipase D-like domain-containing protein [Nitrososphaeria archaeon]
MSGKKNGLTELNRLLSTSYSYKILESLSSGIRVSREMAASLKMRRRTLYKVLKEMRDAGLVTKKNRTYQLTVFGLFVLNMEREILNWLSHNEEVSELSNYLYDAYFFKLANELLKNIERIVGVSNLEPIKVYTDWESLIGSLITRLESAKYEVKLASRYIDMRVIKALYEIAKKGVPIYIITNKENDPERVKQYLGLLSNEELKALATKFYSLPNVNVRSNYVPYSFIIIDVEDVGVEVIDSLRKSFIFGVRFKSPIIASKLSEHFNRIYELAESDRVIESLKEEVRKEWA